MTPEIIDVDCNLLHSDLMTLQKVSTTTTDNNAWNILHEDAVKDANIVAMLSPSSTILESERSLELLKSDPPPPIPIKTTVGVHPYHVNDDDLLFSSTNGERITMEEQKKKIKTIIMTDREEEEEEHNSNKNQFCAAVGECGLDTSEGFPSLDLQVPWFQMQIEIASELEMPLFVHERLAFDKTIELLEKAAPTIPIIIHCFTGTKEECIEYIKRGYFISISGYILKESNDNCAEVISCLEEGIIPLSKLMIETDAPYMGFSGCRQLYLDHNQEFVSSLNSKKRKRLQQSIYPNVPSSLPMVLSKVTECLQKHDSTLTREKVAEVTTENSRIFFGL
jgi:TatD DNase family protein